MSTPTLPVGHEEYAALAVGWVLAALEPADQDRFERHRAGCPACRAEVAAALEVAAELAYGVPDTEPPPALRARVLAITTEPAQRPEPARRPEPGPATGPAFHPALPALADGSAPPPARHRRAARPSRGLRRRVVAGLAAAALVAVSAGVTWEVTRPDRPAPTAAAQTATLTARDGTLATVVVRRDGADVVTDALPPTADRGTEYVLWGVPAGDAAPRRLGSFAISSAGLRSHPVRLVRPVTGYPVLAISEERVGSTPDAPSRVLARGALSR